MTQRIKNGPLRPAFGLLKWGYFDVYKRLQSSLSEDESFYKSAAELNASVLDWLETDADAERWDELRTALADRGDFLENPTHEGGKESDELEDHLRNLGYVE